MKPTAPVLGYHHGAAGTPSRALGRGVLAIVALALAYAIASRVGSMLAIPPGITAFYPPSGIALAALLAWGARVWPGVWLGALASGIWIFHASAPLPLAVASAMGTATGATLQAWGGAWLIRRYCGAPTPFERAEDVFRFVGWAAAAGLLSPTLGTGVLLAAGFIEQELFARTWGTWWVGDFVGVMVFTPLLLTLRMRGGPGRTLEALALLAALVLVAHFVMGIRLPAGIYYDFPLPYPLIPFVIWAALRFGPFGVSVAMLLTSVLTIYGTARGLGPFLADTQNQSLLFAQAFLAVVAVSGLSLAAALRERARAEADSRAAREALHQALERIQEGFYALDRDWRFTYVNQRAQDYFGRSRGELLGRTLWDAIPIAVGSPIEERHRRTMQRGEPERFELLSPLKGRWIEVHAYPSPEGLSVYFHDIDERKHAKERLERTARDLARSNSDLEQFAYIASHDLQEPLRGLTGCMQLLADRAPVRADPKAAEYMQHALGATRRMEGMIRDLLAFSRIERDGRAFEPVALDEVLAEARANLAEAIRESGCKIHAEPLPRIAGDRTRLVGLFQNLLANAIKFRQAARPPEVRIGAHRIEKGWAIAVADNGIGIEPQHAERIFRLFQRLHPRGTYAGTGLGLAICRKIVELHGGEIHVESTPGEGSSFSFSLCTED